MSAIAIESAVPGRDTKSELTHQLATRVAHREAEKGHRPDPYRRFGAR
jgi:hypothetical protein